MENKNYDKKRENEKSLKKHLFLFLKNNILLAGAVFAFILMTAAWFVNNSRVQAGGATVSAAADRKFELAAVGTTGKYDGENGVLKSILGDTVQNGDSWSFAEGGETKTGTITSNDKGDIVWVMSGGQNGQNLNNNTDNSTGTIEPGNSGKLEFYVLPKDTKSEHNFTFTLTVKGYKESDGKYIQMTNSDKFYKLLSGHIQFFSSCDTDGKYSGRLTATATAEGITITGLERSTIANETQEKVTIYWVWPYYVGDMILPDGNGKLSNDEKKTLFTDDLRSAIAGEMADNNADNYGKYFENPIDDTLNGEIADMVNGNIDEAAYNVIYTAYNNADKYIGENGEYILVQLSAAMDN